MKRKLSTLLIGVGLSVGSMGGVASAAPRFDPPQCVGNSMAAAAKANASFGFDFHDFLLDIMADDCAAP
jgi:hypothetical protein